MGRTMKLWLSGVVVVATTIGAAVYAQQTRATTPKLSAEDWIEIRTLYSKYPILADRMQSPADAEAVANLWAEDGIRDFSPVNPPQRGRKAIAAAYTNAYKNGSEGLNTLRRFYSSINVLIEPSPEGAVGTSYFAMMKSGAKEGEPSVVEFNGVYNDTFVKTREGWKFKSRIFRTGPGQAPR